MYDRDRSNILKDYASYNREEYSLKYIIVSIGRQKKKLLWAIPEYYLENIDQFDVVYDAERHIQGRPFVVEGGGSIKVSHSSKTIEVFGECASYGPSCTSTVNRLVLLHARRAGMRGYKITIRDTVRYSEIGRSIERW